MPWTNSPLTLYHGTTNAALGDYRNGKIDLRVFGAGLRLDANRNVPEFGPGFYTTTNPKQAIDWANQKVKVFISRAPQSTVQAIVIAFVVSRNTLSILESLALINADSTFWHFVSHCRQRGNTHSRGLGRAEDFYDIVYGPVSLRGNRVAPGFDQISFHTHYALRTLTHGFIANVGQPFI